MGFFKGLRELRDVAKGAVSIVDQAVVDKDKVVELKGELAKLESLAAQAVQDTYQSELRAPLDFRTAQRPLWSFICVFSFAVEVLSFVASSAFKMFLPAITMEPIAFPLPINVIITSVVMFYFGGRALDKSQRGEFFKKWGV